MTKRGQCLLQIAIEKLPLRTEFLIFACPERRKKETPTFENEFKPKLTTKMCVTFDIAFTNPIKIRLSYNTTLLY